MPSLPRLCSTRRGQTRTATSMLAVLLLQWLLPLLALLGPGPGRAADDDAALAALHELCGTSWQTASASAQATAMPAANGSPNDAPTPPAPACLSCPLCPVCGPLTAPALTGTGSPWLAPTPTVLRATVPPTITPATPDTAWGPTARGPPALPPA